MFERLVKASQSNNQIYQSTPYLLFRNHFETVAFKTIQKKKKEYLQKMDDYLKPVFENFYYSLSTLEQEEFSSLSAYSAKMQTFHNLFVDYLEKKDRTTGGRTDLTLEMCVIHHILPKFEGGADSVENCVRLSQYEHAFVHLLRYSWKKLSKDLNAFSSACLTEDQIQKRQNTNLNPNSERARDNTVRNPEWQETFGRKGWETAAKNRKGKPYDLSLKQEANVSKVGKTYQFSNSRVRANPFHWYLCSQIILLKDRISNKLLKVNSSQNPQEQTAASIAKKVNLLLNEPRIIKGFSN